MDTLITGEKKPRSGLYTLQFSYMPLATENSTATQSGAANLSAAANNNTSPSAAAGKDSTTAAEKKKANKSGNNKSAGTDDDGVIDMSPPLDAEDTPSPTADNTSADAAIAAAAANAAAATGHKNNTNSAATAADAKNKKASAAAAAGNNNKNDANSNTANITDDNSTAAEEEDAATAALLSLDDDPQVREARLQALNKACATEFGSWTLLCRLRFEGDVMGRIKGSVKVKSRNNTSSNNTNTSGAGAQTTSASPSNCPPSSSGVELVATATATGPAVPTDAAAVPTTTTTTDGTPIGSTTVGTATATIGGGACSSSSSLPNGNHISPSSSSSAGTRACIQPDSLWKPSDEVRLVISLDRLDGAVVGLPYDLTNATITCSSHVSDGWYVGSATITLASGQQLKLARRLQFLLREYNGPRCAHCMDPIDAQHTTPTATYGCTSCNCVSYCSSQCQEAHSSGHNAMCAALKPFGGSQGGRAPASFAGAEFYVYWRCVKGCSFELVVDHNNPLGVPYEMQLNPLKDAREGLDYAFLATPASVALAAAAAANAEDNNNTNEAGSSSVPTSSTAADLLPQNKISPQELNELNICIFFAVAQSSREEGALLLTSACLNHLFTYCECVDNLVLSYFQFYDVCVRDQFEGVRHISCLSEYVMYVRTTYELGQTLLEWALKAPFASLFWQRLVAAKDVLVSLYNFNASLQFSPSIQNVKTILVPDQQRQTLHLLAKIFVVMASRAPKDLAQRLLRRAEECYKDSIDEDKPRKNLKEMGVTCLKLAALATLFESEQDKQKATLFKDEGLELLKHAAKAAETAQRARENAAAVMVAKNEAAAAAIANNIAVSVAAAAVANSNGANVTGEATPTANNDAITA